MNWFIKMIIAIIIIICSMYLIYTFNLENVGSKCFFIGWTAALITTVLQYILDYLSE